MSRRCPRRSTAPWSPTQVRGVWLDSADVGFLDCLPVLLVVCRQYSTQQSGAARQMLLLAWPATCLCVPAVPCGLVIIPPNPSPHWHRLSPFSILPLPPPAEYVGEDYEVFSSWLATAEAPKQEA